jgi:adenylate cyclase
MSYKEMGFGSLLANAFQKFPIWIIASTAIMGAIHQVTEGITSVIELNSALTNINMTMNTTQGEMKELRIASQNMAKELGISVKEVLNAAQVYANLNTNVAEIIEKTKADIMLATAAQMSTTDTTDAIKLCGVAA